MFVIGIAGQFCSGKSTIAKIMAKNFKARIVDADKIGHEILLKKEVRKKLVDYFGSGIIVKAGSIDRKSLAAKAFLNKKNHQALCSIMHPTLVGSISNKLNIIRSKSPDAIVVLEAAVLLEMGLLKLVDKLVVVKIARKEQLLRAKAKWNLSQADIDKRLKFQIPLGRLVKEADFIIDNSSNLDNTKKQMEKIRSAVWQKMKK